MNYLAQEYFLNVKKNDLFKEEIFEKYYYKVYSTAYYITKDEFIAQDVTQETFIKAFNQFHTLKDLNKVGPWLGSITTRTAIDFLRKIKKWNDFTINDVYIDRNPSNPLISPVEKILEDQYLRKLIQEQASKLKPDYRELLILKYDYGLKDEEIAEKLHQSLGTVKSKIHRAKQKLIENIRKQMKGKGSELG